MRWDIINYYLAGSSARRYVEIGLQFGTTFNKVRCTHKESVDPDPQWNATSVIASDEWFATDHEPYDVVFVDGLHHAEQVYRDINNALNCIVDNGVVVCHDMNPPSEIMQRVPRETKWWTGDGWKAWVRLRSERADLSMFVIDTDFGCGVIRKGRQERIQLPETLDWSTLDENRVALLGLISVDEWLACRGK